jgi:hypothetical protein
MRDLMAEALCICRLFLSRAVIGFELLLLLLLFAAAAAPDLLPPGLADAGFVDRRRDGPAGGTCVSGCRLTCPCAPSAGLATTWAKGFRPPELF